MLVDSRLGCPWDAALAAGEAVDARVSADPMSPLPGQSPALTGHIRATAGEEQSCFDAEM